MRLTNKKKEKKDIGYGVKTLIWNIPSFFHLTGEVERCRVLREIDRSKLRLQLQTRLLGQDQHHVRPLVHQGPLPGGHWDDGQGGHDRKVSDSFGSFLQGCWRNQVRTFINDVMKIPAFLTPLSHCHTKITVLLTSLHIASKRTYPQLLTFLLLYAFLRNFFLRQDWLSGDVPPHLAQPC